mmetsp:Transcript_23470/g.57497  ORF Transcript_23470/g.57497 Transcript_23470/m.57497 type:complete len:173 (-) Transcript_23470:57-575(-)
MASTTAPTTRPMVSEASMDFLLIELVRTYHERGDAGRKQMEAMGFQVGTQLAERYTRDRARFTEQTEIILFLCKEFWLDVFKKRVDNLKTNNRGVYVLQDNAFRWTRNLHAWGPTDAEGEAALKAYGASCTHFPCGIIRGMLSHLGLACTVTGDAAGLPGVTFTLRLKGSTA